MGPKNFGPKNGQIRALLLHQFLYLFEFEQDVVNGRVCVAGEKNRETQGMQHLHHCNDGGRLSWKHEDNNK
ncbi:hypothetical protein DPMN_055887 [Dreissena polymorpha]|uniref:Uncharacterized protein n=1 Tax=Dreissena polymorpha TaxID=45954 RepID=A0A9D4HSP2_DREPO|nr:hypothetical protein DPMN_055887 [Dreissena polymorpha]